MRKSTEILGISKVDELHMVAQDGEGGIAYETGGATTGN